MTLKTLRPIIGTLSHNRSFTAAEVSEYSRYRFPEPALNGSAVVRYLVRRELIERTGQRGHYYPTSAGWRWLDGDSALPDA